ncbi:MAG: T9SS type A sorting domain-containing protein [Bacteroidia bacterium]
MPNYRGADLQASNIAGSIDTIATYDGFYDPIPLFQTAFYLAHLANNGKIYINTGTGTQWMHEINYPDSAGAACDLQQHSLKLPTINAFTIPNYPNFFLGAEGGTVYDSLITSVNSKNLLPELILFPNPVRNIMYLTGIKNKIGEEISVRNVLGQPVKISVNTIQSGEYLEFNTSSLLPGVYFVELISGKERVVKRFIKE